MARFSGSRCSCCKWYYHVVTTWYKYNCHMVWMILSHGDGANLHSVRNVSLEIKVIYFNVLLLSVWNLCPCIMTVLFVTYGKMRFQPELHPGPHCKLRTLPQTSSQLGREYPSHPHPTRILPLGDHSIWWAGGGALSPSIFCLEPTSE